MDRKEFQHRRADKVSLDQSKKQLWNYIQKKTEKKPKWYEGFFNFFQGHKFSFIGTMAVVLILALVSYNFNFPLIKPEVVRASFEMSAPQEDEMGIPSNGSFILKASEDLSEKTIEANLTVQPKVEVKVDKTSEGQYKIIPAKELEPGQVYQFSILSEVNGKPQEFSWAYQVKDAFKVMGSLPADQQTYIELDSGIEINFSHENFDFDHAKDFFEISPPTEGSFEKHTRTLTFIPKNPLKEGTLYTVKLKEGFKLNKSDKKIEKPYQFQFETKNLNSPESGIEFLNPYYEVAANKTVGVKIMGVSVGYDHSVPLPVTVYKFPTQEAYLKILEERAKIPTWATSAKREAPLVPTDLLSSVGQFEAIVDQIDYTDYMYLPTATFEKGFYLFEINNSDFKSQALVQITNLSAYINITETDTLIWVNDMKTGNPIQDAKIELIDGQELGHSDEEGIAIFKTPEALKDVNQLQLLKITAGAQTLIHLTEPEHFGYQEEKNTNYWYSLTTDRSTYKPTDTLKFWGFIKPKTADFKTDDLRLVLHEGFADDSIKEQALKISAQGTFIGELDLDHLTQSYYSLGVYQNDLLISEKLIYVQNYQKPAYQITVETDKKAIFSGETMNFELNSSFFDGTPLPNLDLSYKSDWARGELKTNKDGEASLKVKTEVDNADCSHNYCGNQEYYNISFAPKQAEETDISGSSSVQIFKSKIALKAVGTSDETQGKIALTSHAVDLDQFEATGDYFGKLIPSQKVTGVIKEVTWDKQEKGQYYDYINKKVHKTYIYTPNEKLLNNFTVITDEKGQANYEFKIDPKRYYYILLKATDEEGRVTTEKVYIYGEMALSQGAEYSGMTLYNTQEREYDLGDEVQTLFNSTYESLDSNKKSKYLFQQASNGLREYVIQDSPYYNFEFEKEDVPNVYVSGVQFTGQNYVVPYGSLDLSYKKELKRLNIKVTPDKERYAPGEKVKLQVLVTDKDNKPVKAEVNLNLVDEAYYKAVYEELKDPLDDLYSFNEQGQIYSDNTHDNPILPTRDFDGGGGCFVAGTKILMSDGSYKNIESIQQGDMILTKKDPLSPEMVAAKVLTTVSHKVGQYLILNENLKVTKEHVIFVDGQFKVAGDIHIGDKLLNKDHQYIEVRSIREVKEPVMVYNFQVQNQHTYFANDFYVHNDKGGDGIRSDFEDNALFEAITTNSKGIAETEFQLPDNITSWRVTAKAIDSKNLQAGMGAGAIPVSLPLFTDLIMNPEYSVQDEPTLKFRAYGDQLTEGEEVDFNLSAKTLDLDKKQIQGEAFKGSYLSLPKLSLGNHEVVLQTRSGKLSDTISKPLVVVGSRLDKDVLQFIPKIEATTTLKLSKEKRSEINFTDGGRGLYYYDLMNLYLSEGDRLDQRLSQLGAQNLLKDYFKQSLPLSNFDFLSYQNSTGGFQLLPYSDDDLEMTVLSLLMNADSAQFNQQNLKNYLYNIYQDKDANLEEIVLALTGLAALHEPVLNSIKLLQKETSLDLKEHLYLALAFQALGNTQEAQKIYKHWVQDLELGPHAGELKALEAVLAASLNDPKANILWEGAVAAQEKDIFLGLYQIGYLTYRLKYSEAQPVQFTFIKNGKPQNISLEKGDTFPVTILPQDQIKIKVLKGQLAGTFRYSEKADISDFKPDKEFKIDRSYQVKDKVSDEFKEGDIVKVVLNVYAGKSIKKDGFKITDILPSGLTPITSQHTYYSGYAEQESYDYPYQVDGQKVGFIWYPSLQDRNGSQGTIEALESWKTFTYLARVVTPGKFYADPAKIESFKDPEIRVISKENWVVIEKSEE